MLVRTYGVIAFVVASYAIGLSSCAITQKSVPVTPLHVIKVCNAWVWVRTVDGRPIIGATVWGLAGTEYTDHMGYACFEIREPSKVRIEAGPNFHATDILILPNQGTREVRLSWLSRAE